MKVTTFLILEIVQYKLWTLILDTVSFEVQFIQPIFPLNKEQSRRPSYEKA